MTRSSDSCKTCLGGFSITCPPRTRKAAEFGQMADSGEPLLVEGAKPIADSLAVESRRRWLRPALMLSLPLLLAAVGGYLWLTGGRYVSTDNAYVQQDKVSVSADVGGRIIAVAVRENQKV